MITKEAKYYSLSTGVLLRIGDANDIMNQYNEGYIKFGCPANWINYDKKNGIADTYEALIGHVRKDDPRLATLGDDGIPLNMFRSLWIDDGPDDTVYVRYIWHCLMPTLCLFSVPVNQIAMKRNPDGDKRYCLRINMNVFYKAMGFDLDKCSVLLINEPEDFFAELDREIPKAIASRDDLHVTTPRSKQSEHSFLASMIEYDLDISKEFFEINSFDDMFKKRPEYSNQNEARIIIPNVGFCSDPVFNENSYKDNQLVVSLPNIQKYSSIHSANEVHYIDFFYFNKTFDRYEIGVF